MIDLGSKCYVTGRFLSESEKSYITKKLTLAERHIIFNDFRGRYEEAHE